MDINKITTDWLKEQKFILQKQLSISGVILKELNSIVDGRGDLIELWSYPWISSGFIIPNHCYQSSTDFGVVKCWHLHEIHTDQFAVTRGKLQVCLVDLREESPTFGDANIIFMGIQKPGLLKIPPGILHGWKALSFPDVSVINFQSHMYDVSDEYKFIWNCILENIWEPRNG